MSVLYDYFRSSACFRVRIALELKGIAYESRPIHLLNNGGEHHADSYLALNPAGLVPVYVDGAAPISQSLAILEYLEEVHASPPLLPSDPAARAWVRSVALSVACDIHPLNNLRVLAQLEQRFDASPDARAAWINHWIEDGLATVEAMLARHPRTSRYAHGDTPTMADLCIVPQVTNAKRFGSDLAHVPRVVALYEHCIQTPAFHRAAPDAVVHHA